MMISTLLIHGDADTFQSNRDVIPPERQARRREAVRCLRERRSWPLCHPPRQAEFRPLRVLHGGVNGVQCVNDSRRPGRKICWRVESGFPETMNSRI